jgi:hypothetical protein
MHSGNDPFDLGRMEDDFNNYLDKLARGESTEAFVNDIDPMLADAALRVHAMAARTRPEANLMYRTWSTVGASGEAAGAVPAATIPAAPRVASRPRERQRTGAWRFSNHAALAAVLIVALLTGYAGIKGELPGGGSNQNMGSTLSAQPSTPYVALNIPCTTEPRTVDEVADIFSTPTVPQNPENVTISSEPPDAETIAGVQETQQQMVACGEDPLRTYALYTDSCLRSELAAKDPEAVLKPAAIRDQIAAEATAMAEKRGIAAEIATPGANIDGIYDVILAGDIELLSDGRVGAIVRQAAVNGETALIPQSPRYTFFVKDGDKLLYDCDAPQFHG